MALGEYLWAWSSITKWLYHLNWNSNDNSGNSNNGTSTNITWIGGVLWSGKASLNSSNSYISIPNLWAIWTWDFSFSIILNTTETNTSVLLSKWPNKSSGTWWYISLISYWGTPNLLFAANDGSGWSNSINNTNAYNDWNPHFIKIWRKSWVLYYYYDWELLGSVAFANSIPNTMPIVIWNFSYLNSTLYFWWSSDEFVYENKLDSSEDIMREYTYKKWRFWIL